MQKGENGYGFNLHSKKSTQGQFIRAVDEDSPAARAGLKVQDKIVQVNTHTPPQLTLLDNIIKSEFYGSSDQW